MIIRRMGWQSFRSKTKILIWPKEDQGCSAFLVVAINVFFLLFLSPEKEEEKSLSHAHFLLSLPRENARASMLLNELVLRDSFNFIPWKNSTSSRGFFRGGLLLPRPEMPEDEEKYFPSTGHSFKLRRPTGKKIGPEIQLNLVHE